MRRILVALVLISAIGPAHAAEPQQMLLMQQSLIDVTREYVRHPDINKAVDLWLALTACENANQAAPSAPDGCPVVSQALEAGRKAAAAQAAPPAATATPAPAAAKPEPTTH